MVKGIQKLCRDNIKNIWVIFVARYKNAPNVKERGTNHLTFYVSIYVSLWQKIIKACLCRIKLYILSITCTYTFSVTDKKNNLSSVYSTKSPKTSFSLALHGSFIGNLYYLIVSQATKTIYFHITFHDWGQSTLLLYEKCIYFYSGIFPTYR